MRHTPSSKKVKVENHPSLQRDTSTSAIVNTDNRAYQRYMNEKDVRLIQKHEIDDLRHQIEVLKEFIIKDK